jgi:hypothetical protein
MRNDDKDERRLILLIFMWSILFTIVFVLLAGCTKTIYVPTPEYHEVHDTIVKKEIVEKEVIKEVSVRDSSSFRQSGDTIRIERWHWERDYSKEKALQAKIDSLSHIERDTVFLPYPVSDEVPAELTNMQIFFMTLGKVLLVIGILLLLIVIVKRRFFLRH